MNPIDVHRAAEQVPGKIIEMELINLIYTQQNTATDTQEKKGYHLLIFSVINIIQLQSH